MRIKQLTQTDNFKISIKIKIKDAKCFHKGFIYAALSSATFGLAPFSPFHYSLRASPLSKYWPTDGE